MPLCDGLGRVVRVQSEKGQVRRRWFCCQACEHRWKVEYSAEPTEKQAAAQEQLEQRVRLVFEEWERCGSAPEVARRLGFWSRQMVRLVLQGQVCRDVAPDLQRLAAGTIGRRCEDCRHWLRGRPPGPFDEGVPAACGLGIPEAAEGNGWARLCSAWCGSEGLAGGEGGEEVEES